MVKAPKEQPAKEDGALLALRMAANATPQCWQALKAQRAEELQSLPPASNQIDPQSTANVAAVIHILQGPLQYKGHLPASVEEMLQLVASRIAEVMDNLEVFQDFARSVGQAVGSSISTAASSAWKSDMSASTLAMELKHIQIRSNEILGSRKQERPWPQALCSSPSESLESGQMANVIASGQTGDRDRWTATQRHGRPAAPVLQFPKPLAEKEQEESDNDVCSEDGDSSPPQTPRNWVYRRAFDNAVSSEASDTSAPQIPRTWVYRRANPAVPPRRSSSAQAAARPTAPKQRGHTTTGTPCRSSSASPGTCSPATKQQQDPFDGHTRPGRPSRGRRCPRGADDQAPTPGGPSAGMLRSCAQPPRGRGTSTSARPDAPARVPRNRSAPAARFHSRSDVELGNNMGSPPGATITHPCVFRTGPRLAKSQHDHAPESRPMQYGTTARSHARATGVVGGRREC